MRSFTKPIVAGVIAVVLCSALIVALIFALYIERPPSVSEAAAPGPVSPLPTMSQVAPTNTTQPTGEGPIKYYPPVSDRPDATPVPLTPEPFVPPTPYLEAAKFSDPSGILNIVVPKGWYVTGPGVTALRSTVVIANYDYASSPSRPDYGINVRIGIGEMEVGQTFEQWLAERIQDELSQGNGGPPAVLMSEPEPVELAGRSGVSLMLGVDNEIGVGADVLKSMYIPINDRWVMGVSVRPISSSDYETALAMLETLHISDIK